MRISPLTNAAESEQALYDTVRLIRVDANETLLPTAAVGAGQTVLLEPGVGGASFLQLADATVFAGTIAEFGSSDTIQLTSPTFDGAAVSTSGGISTLKFTRQGAPGRADQAAGRVRSGNRCTRWRSWTTPGAVVTTIHTTVPDQPANFVADTAIDISGKETGDVCAPGRSRG